MSKMNLLTDEDLTAIKQRMADRYTFIASDGMRSIDGGAGQLEDLKELMAEVELLRGWYEQVVSDLEDLNECHERVLADRDRLADAIRTFIAHDPGCEQEDDDAREVGGWDECPTCHATFPAGTVDMCWGGNTHRPSHVNPAR